MKREIRLVVNGESHQLEVELQKTLLEVLRDDLGLIGAKYSCGEGDCGSCTVLLEGKPVSSCLTLAVNVDGQSIITIEGLAEGDRLHPLQEAFIEHGAIQCGYCTSGMILTAKSLLDENPQATEEDVKLALTGNLCRCTGYVKIVEAVIAAGEKMYEQGDRGGKDIGNR
jgi:carbon-monoxide dehydrogenase small subunit